MARNETVTLTNMCMVVNEKGEWLMEDRKSPVWGGLVFPGGHVESNESFVQSVIREVKEETGLSIREPALCGVKQFRDYDGNRYIVFLFRASQYAGEIVSSSEGEISWMKPSEVAEWISEGKAVEGFEDLLKVFLDESVSEVCYEGIWDRDGEDQAVFF